MLARLPQRETQLWLNSIFLVIFQDFTTDSTNFTLLIPETVQHGSYFNFQTQLLLG